MPLDHKVPKTSRVSRAHPDFISTLSSEFPKIQVKDGRCDVEAEGSGRVVSKLCVQQVWLLEWGTHLSTFLPFSAFSPKHLLI